MDATSLPGQDAAHPDGQYGSVAKWFHWITVGLIAVALPTGFVIKFITGEADGAYKMGFYAIHESAGVTILIVAVLRLLWRWRHPPPPLPDHLPAPMRIAAAASHHALYALLILQPILGFFATNAPGDWFGTIRVPRSLPVVPGWHRRDVCQGRKFERPALARRMRVSRP